MRHFLAVALLLSTIVACGRSGGSSSMPAPAPAGSLVGALVVVAAPQTASNATGPWVISAAAVDQNGNPLPNVTVTLSTTQGQISPSQGQTDSLGGMSATLTPPTSSGTSTPVAAVLATAGDKSAVVDVAFQNVSVQSAGRGRGALQLPSSGGSQFQFGTTLGSGASTSGVFYTNPSSCYAPYTVTLTTACQQVLAQNNVQLTPSTIANVTCQASGVINTAAGVVSCVGVAATIVSCATSVLPDGVSQVICGASLAIGGFGLAPDCAEFLAGAIAQYVLKDPTAVIVLDQIGVITDPTNPLAVIQLTCDSLGAPANTLFADNFSQDVALNSYEWTTSGSLLTQILENFDNPAASVVTPTLIFSSSDGLAMGGVNSNYRHTGIQTTQAFTPPFTATVQTTLTSTTDGGLTLTLVTAGDNAGVQMGVSNGTSPFNGIWYQGAGPSYPPTSNDPWSMQGQLQSAGPQPGTIYTLTISVNSSGQATVSASSNGQTIGSGTAQAGTGPFYMVLDVGTGLLSGQPTANWYQVTVQGN